MGVPIPEEMQVATEAVIDLALFGWSVGRIGRAGSPISSPRTGRLDDLDPRRRWGSTSPVRANTRGGRC